MDTLRRGLSSRIIYYKVTAEVLLGSLCALILIGVSTAGLFAQPASFPDSSRKVEYRLEPLSGGLQQLEKMFNSAQLMLLEKLNRCDLKHLARHSNIVVPLSWHSNELMYSPLPQTYAWAKQCPEALVVHQPSQCFGGYEYGHLVRWGPISSGRENRQTPAGFFHLNWRSRGKHSTVDPDWYMPWYFNFENKLGLSLHQYSLPCQPASHACIRLLERDAKWLYDWGEQWKLDSKGWNVLKPGTPLLIVGHYNFAEPPPWRSIEWLTHGVELPENPTPGRQPCPAAALNGSNQSDAVNPAQQEPDTR